MKFCVLHYCVRIKSFKKTSKNQTLSIHAFLKKFHAAMKDCSGFRKMHRCKIHNYHQMKGMESQMQGHRLEGF